jgi:hypothetical protein
MKTGFRKRLMTATALAAAGIFPAHAADAQVTTPDAAQPVTKRPTRCR